MVSGLCPIILKHKLLNVVKAGYGMIMAEFVDLVLVQQAPPPPPEKILNGDRTHLASGVYNQWNGLVE